MAESSRAGLGYVATVATATYTSDSLTALRLLVLNDNWALVDRLRMVSLANPSSSGGRPPALTSVSHYAMIGLDAD